jgi:Fur family transcriptional regulator, zinc uptake regulator
MNEQDVLATLRAAGYRLTGPRRKLVDLLLQADTPLTADAIYHRVRQARVQANLSTIYRNLATFCEMGWLQAVPGPTGERHYQVQAGGEQHMSVMCLDCGELTSLKVDAAGPLNAAVRDMGFNAQSLRVTVAAHCEHVCPRKTEAR